MLARDLFDNKYLAADDLRGKPWTLTIARVEKTQLRKKAERKGEKDKMETRGVIFFAELEAKATKDKPAMGLVLNRTNAKSVIALYGKETNAWIGRRLTVYPTTCFSFGQTVDCIRIEPDEPPAAKSKLGEPKPTPEPPADHESP